MNEHRKQILISFVLPIIILLCIYIAWRQYPFGDNTLLIWDMNWQYASFFAHLHDILHGNASALYSFSRAIGGNMLSVAVYYLMSPFNLLFYFFDAEHIYIGILVISLLKAGACGITMHWSLNRKHPGGASVVFSTCYALSAYVIGYQFNPFWIDALILLPLVCGGIEILVDEKKYLFYSLAIGLSVITNFYMGYMICLFSVLYFLCYSFLNCRKEGERYYKICLRYIGGSLLGGMLSMCIVLPTLDALQGGKINVSYDLLFDFRKLLESREIFDVAFCGMISRQQINYGKPLIYCSVFTILMVMYWIFCGRDTIKTKIAYLFFILLLILSFCFYNLNCVWHAFREPGGSPHRFAFIFTFLLLHLAYEGYSTLIEKAVLPKYDKIAVLGTWFVLMLGLYYRKYSFRVTGGVAIFFFNALLVTVYILWILFGRDRKAGIYFVASLIGVELFVNAIQLYRSSEQYDSVQLTEYRSYMEQMLPLVDKMKEDDTFYRSAFAGEAERTGNGNDLFMLNLYGLESYTSVEKQDIMQIAGNFGYHNNVLWGMRYKDGATKAGESFLGVKYIISSEDPGDGYQLLGQNGNLALYENPYALPIAVLADGGILEMEYDNGQVFDYINELYRCLCMGQDTDIFTKFHGQLREMNNCKEIGNGLLQVDDPTKEAYVEYEFKADIDGPAYALYENTGISEAWAFVGDREIDLHTQENIVKRLGSLNNGENVQIRLCLSGEEAVHLDSIEAYGEQIQVLRAYTDSIRANQIDITMHSDAKLAISCYNDNNDVKYLLCTIPYEKGWKTKLDGVKVDAQKIGNFIAIPIEYGAHEIEMNFVPPGLYVGLCITVGTILLMIALYLVKNVYVAG